MGKIESVRLKILTFKAELKLSINLINPFGFNPALGIDFISHFQN